MKPLLFLDVDGVLNCLNATVPGEWINKDTGWQAFVPEGTKERIARLVEGLDPIWATAWMGGAHGPFRDHLRLSETPWPYVNWADMKLPAILRYAKDRPWVWIDDDAEWELKKLGWSEDMVPGLILQPHSREGLTDAHVDAALSLVAA